MDRRDKGRMGQIIATLVFCLGFMALWPLEALEAMKGGGAEPFSRSTISLGLGLIVLSLGPVLLLMTTSFTRFVVVFSFLRTALGLQQSPPNLVILALSFFLTLFTMQPTLQQAYDTAVVPYMEGHVTEEQGFQALMDPFHAFMRTHVGHKEVALFYEFLHKDVPKTPEEISMGVLVPAFMLSELRHAFEIGFLIFLPFVVVDLIVASVTMSLGMMMLPPSIISLPFKIIFFVLIDGWSLLTSALVKGYGVP